jgi:hypothetical protein
MFGGQEDYSVDTMFDTGAIAAPPAITESAY